MLATMFETREGEEEGRVDVSRLSPPEEVLLFLNPGNLV
jgi:hypothetical protein